MLTFWPHFRSIFGSAFRGHMAASLPSFGKPKRGKVLILPERGAQNCPPRKAPQDTSKASLLGPSWNAQAAPWGARKGPKKSPSTGGKFAKKSSQIGPQRVPQGPCLGRAGRARWAGVRGSLGAVGGVGFGVGLAEVVCRGGLDWWSVLGGFLVGWTTFGRIGIT